MQQAYLKRDKLRLAQLLPAAHGHVLEPWAAYWELRARLGEATSDEVQAFLARWAGTYQEDRLRNDWLLLLGQRRDWGNFAALHPAFRMGDDREVQCYAGVVDLLSGGKADDIARTVKANWYAQRDYEDGCNYAAGELFTAGKLSESDVWRRARIAAEAGRLRAARAAVEIVAPVQLPALKDVLNGPARYLTKAKLQGKVQQELATLALVRVAADNPDGAATLMSARWAELLPAEQRDWVWGVIGKEQALKLSSDALAAYARVAKDSRLSDDMLAWKVRAALRAGNWQAVRKSIEAMSDEARADSTWIYWRAKALQQGKVDAFVINNVSAAAFANQSQKGPRPAMVLEEPLYVQPVVIGMTKGETALIKEVNTILHKLEDSGYMDQHWNKWFGDASDYKLKRPYKVTPIKDVKFEPLP